MRELKSILIENNFRFDKRLGQNFITDTNLLKAIVADSGVSKDSDVIEVGAGGGTLTRELSLSAKKVYAYEIDKNLKPVLAETLKDIENVELNFNDIMKEEISDIERNMQEGYYLVANLPYYITTPLIMKFIENAKKLKSMTVMVQKEVAERLCAKAGGKDYGSVTVAIDFCGGAKIMRYVSRNIFYPVPNVDSAIIRIDIKNDIFDVKDKDLFYKLYRCAFAMRRKTLLNNMLSVFDLNRQQIEKLITGCGYDVNIRGETLSASDFVNLSNKIYNFLNN